MNSGTARLALLIILIAATHFRAQAGAPISFIGYKNPSSPIFSKAGPTVINYQLYDEYIGIRKPGAGLEQDGLVIVVIRNSNNDFLYSYSVPLSSVPGGFSGHTGKEFGQYLLTKGSFQFSNPSDQNLIIEEQIWYNKPIESVAGFASQEWTSASGRSVVFGGDAPTGPVPPVSNPVPVPVSTSIHAIIISGRSDPAKIVTSPNVTLTGGVVALGKDTPSAATTHWVTGLHIVPDEALLTGAKIPPLTPNIIDVRIVRHEVVGDLAVPGAFPSP
jgi:hypothetical protein